MKKLVLLALLAGSMLASCATASKGGMAAKIDADPLAGFFEDTDAHEEIFGKQTLPFVNLPKSAPIEPVGGSAAIKLGVQKATFADGEHAGKAVRFIAAVNFTNVSTDTAVWTRTIWHDLNSGDDSGKVFKAEAEKESTKAYLSLNNGGVEYTISDFNASPAAGGNTYTHFVVYTIGGISGSSFDKYIINAYLTINDDAEHPSDVLSTTVDLTTSFTFPKAKIDRGYFGVKKTSSGFAPVDRDADNGGNHARFIDVDLAVGDDFLIVNACADYFAIHGFDMVNLGDSTDHFSQEEDSSQFAKAKFNATYNFYLSSGYETNNWIYVSAAAPKNISLKPGVWNTGGAWFAVYAWNSKNSVDSHQSWYKSVSNDGTYWQFTVNVDPALALYVICGRMVASYEPDANWTDAWTENTGYWNRTNNISMGSNTSIEITGWDQGNHSES